MPVQDPPRTRTALPAPALGVPGYEGGGVKVKSFSGPGDGALTSRSNPIVAGGLDLVGIATGPCGD